MIVDSRSIPNNERIETEICIIGAGPAGISLALELEGQPYRVILLEAGGLRYNRSVQALYRAENIGLKYDDLDQARSRYFGGSSNCWGGLCRPFDEHDFERRDWVPNSGWPITRSTLLPFYQRAQKILQLGDFDYDPTSWQQRFDRSDFKLIGSGSQRLANQIIQISAPTRFGRLYRQPLVKSRNVLTYLNSSATEIKTPGNGKVATAINVRTLTGRVFQIVARVYILATGGIEVPRLLLASNRYQPVGIGNTYDLVGRYFMDHARLCASEIRFQHPAQSLLYDLDGILAGSSTRLRGVKLGAQLSLIPEVQRSERIGNMRCYVRSRLMGDDPDTILAAQRLLRILRRRTAISDYSRTELATLLKQIPRLGRYAISSKLGGLISSKGLKLETVVEPTPCRESRVRLGTGCDALGLQNVQVNWQLGEIEKRTFQRTQEILAAELVGENGGTLVNNSSDKEWPAGIMGCWHHMGTTRMSDSEREGVVDANCRVHGTQNLFVAGSSVFPTCGSDMPTLTIVALALRLADHIKALFK